MISSLAKVVNMMVVTIRNRHCLRWGAASGSYRAVVVIAVSRGLHESHILPVTCNLSLFFVNHRCPDSNWYG